MNQEDIIRILKDYGPMTVPELADAFEVDNAVIYPKIRALEKRGIVAHIGNTIPARPFYTARIWGLLRCASTPSP